MPEGLRAFTLEEANALVPRLTQEFQAVAELREKISKVCEHLGGASAAQELLEHHRLPKPSEKEAAEELRRLATEINRTLRRIQELGCVVKDVELGLVDFHSEVEGRHMFLCWQYGEAAVGHFHALDEGYGERQPLKSGHHERGPEQSWLN